MNITIIDKLRFVGMLNTTNYVPLGTLISPAKTIRCGDNSYPVLSMTMHNGLVFQDDKFKKEIASKDKSDYKVVYRNQLVISFPIDEGVLAAQRIVDAGIVSPAYGIWDIDQSQILPEFLENALRCERAIAYYKAKLRGSTARRRSLPTPTLLEFTIPLPSLKKQEYILDVVSKIKKILDNRKTELHTLDNLIKARFVEMSSAWNCVEKPLFEYLESITYGFTNPMPDAEEGPWKITAKDVVNGHVNFETARKTTKEAFDELTDKSKPNIGDVLLTKDGTLGRTAIVENENICVNQSVAVLRCNDKVVPRFLSLLLQLPEYQREMIKNSGGGTIKHIYITKVDKMLVMIPSINQQKEFIKFVEQVDKSKVAVQRALDETQILFDSLMQKYFG